MQMIISVTKELGKHVLLEHKFSFVQNIPKLTLINSLVRMEKNLMSVIAVTQMTCTADKKENWQQLEELVCKAVQDGAKVVFLPEGCDYIASNRKESLELAEDIGGPFISNLCKLAKRKQVWLSAGGVHVKSANDNDTRLSNTHLLISADGLVRSRYSKSHLFSNSIPGVSIREADYVRPGEELVAPVPSPAGNIGLAICYDLRFPELSQTLRRLGSHVLTFPSAFTVATGTAHWHTLLRSRAIECQSYVVAAAQSGQHNPKRSSYGHALIADPWGRVLCELADGPGVAVAEVDLAALARVRQEMPCVQHSRQDLCGLSLAPVHSHPRLLHLERSPPACTLYRFGQVTVPGDAVFLNSALAYAFTNLYPRMPGHCMVSPRNVVPRFSALSPGEVSGLAQLTVQAFRVMCARHGVTQCEVALQDGAASGQTIEHVHVHLLPQPSSSLSLLSPDVTSLQQSEAAQALSKSDREAAMVAEATALRRRHEPPLLDDDALHTPQPFDPLPVEAGPEHRTAGVGVPPSLVCFRGLTVLAYCVRGSWQKCHVVVQLSRKVDTLGEVRPCEAHELFAAAHRLQRALEAARPGLATTFVVRPRDEHFESVHVHILPWLIEHTPSDGVYSFVSTYQRCQGDAAEEELAAAIRGVVCEGASSETLARHLG